MMDNAMSPNEHHGRLEMGFCALPDDVARLALSAPNQGLQSFIVSLAHTRVQLLWVVLRTKSEVIVNLKSCA